MTSAVDLFAGLGGFTLGASMAGCRVLWAANHDPLCVAYHAINHPGTRHACQDLQQADWSAVPRHDLLLASPACQGHSRARGRERARHDAQRATAWAVVAALEVRRAAAAIVENVPEFASWALFPAWRFALERLGYSVAHFVRDAADHGVPQHRKRLFVVATRSRNPISLKLPSRAHRAASGIVDFAAGSWSPIRRKGRSSATLERVANGRKRFGRRFLMPYYGSGSGLTGRSLELPIGTITTRDRWALVDGKRMRMLTVGENRAAMAFPESTELPAQHHAAIAMLGNAVPPPMARDVIRAVLRAA